MVLKKEDQAIKDDANMRGGNGVVHSQVLPTPSQAGGKGRLYNITTLDPGCSIGYHVHHGESESYYIISGQALFNDNGEQTTLSAGDFALCENEHGHSIENNSSEPLVFMALILEAAQ